MATFLAFRLAAKRICSVPTTPGRPRSPHISPVLLYSSKHSSNARLRNTHIPFPDVYLADSSSNSINNNHDNNDIGVGDGGNNNNNNNNSKLIKIPLKDLAQIDPDESYVKLQTKPSDTSSLPIVRIIDRKEAAARKKVARERMKQSLKRNVKKEFQFTWSMALGSLEHRLGRARAELGKGARVDWVFAPRRGARTPPVGEMRERMEMVAGKVEDVGVEWKPRELQRGIGAIFVQSRGVKFDEDEE